MDRITIPYGFTTLPWTQNPSAASQDAIFYAVNPYWQVYTAYIEYCNNANQTGSMQIMMLSSWARISVWKVDAYRYCPRTAQQDACYADMVQGTVLRPDLPKPTVDATMCDQQLDFVVTGMQYMDEENIAISVLRSTPANIDPTTLQPRQQALASTVTYFLHSKTMQVREGVSWKTEIPQVAGTVGVLCPALRQMPQLGSIATELVVASILFVRTPFHLLLNGVYMFPRWMRPGADTCPLVSHGHSGVRTACGTRALSMKPFFDSVDRLNAFLFRSISIIAHNMEDKISPRTLTFINGVKMYGENTMNPLLSRTVVGSIASMFAALPLDQLSEKIVDKLPSFDLGIKATRVLSSWKMLQFFVDPTQTADFVYHFVVDVVYNTLQNAAADKKILQSVGKGMQKALYDNEQDYYEIITQKLLNACTGVSLAIGYTNPYATFTRQAKCERALSRGLVSLTS